LGGTDGCDLVGVPGWGIEIKRAKEARLIYRLDREETNADAREFQNA
jgi:hypothetical protein